jgi:hypothetical protein
MSGNCGPLPEFQITTDSDMNIANILFKDRKISLQTPVGEAELSVEVPSGATLDRGFINTISSQFSDYIQGDELRDYTTCKLGETTGISADKLQDLGNKGTLLMDKLHDLGNKGSLLVEKADTLKDKSKETTITTLNKINKLIESFRLIISLILTLLTCFVIFLALNIVTNWLTYGKKKGLIIMGFLSLIFGVTFATFYYGYSKFITIPFIKQSNIVKTYFEEPEQKIEEESKYTFILPYIVITLLILALLTLLTYIPIKK